MVSIIHINYLSDNLYFLIILSLLGITTILFGDFTKTAFLPIHFTFVPAGLIIQNLYGYEFYDIDTLHFELAFVTPGSNSINQIYYFPIDD